MDKLVVALAFLVVVNGARAGDTSDPASVAAQMRDFLAGAKIDKVQVKTIGRLLVLDGEVELPSHLDAVEKIVQGTRQAEPTLGVQSLVKLCPATWNLIAERVEREIGSPDITARFIAHSLFLEGIAESEFEGDRAVVLAKAHLTALHVPMRTTTPADPGERSVASAGTEGVTIIDLLRVKPLPGKKRK